VGDELVDFFERPRVEQEVDAFASGQLAAVVLTLLPVGAAAEFRAALEVREDLVRINHVALSSRLSAIS
jgi:hypothetical protein